MFTGRSPLFIVVLALAALLVAACGSGPGSDAPAASSPDATRPASAPSPTETDASNPIPAPGVEIGMVPDFELPSAGGGTVKLSDVYARGNTVLVFYRGYF